MIEKEARECIICRKQRGELPIPGGAIYLDEVICVSHAHIGDGQSEQYLGWLVVEPRRHIPGLAELNKKEALMLGILLARLSRLLKVILGAEHVYAFVLGHEVPHLHVHLLPRYPGTPREFWGVGIDEWPDAPRGDAQVLAKLGEELRANLADEANDGS